MCLVVESRSLALIATRFRLRRLMPSAIPITLALRLRADIRMLGGASVDAVRSMLSFTFDRTAHDGSITGLDGINPLPTMRGDAPVCKDQCQCERQIASVESAKMVRNK